MTPSLPPSLPRCCLPSPARMVQGSYGWRDSLAEEVELLDPTILAALDPPRTLATLNCIWRRDSLAEDDELPDQT